MNLSTTTHIPNMQTDTTESSTTRRPAWELALDYGISILSLLLLLPLILAVIVLVKIVSPGPAIFKQRRIGLNGKTFMIYKLRTMHLNATTQEHEHHFLDLIRSNRPMTKMDAGGDARLIPFGRFLRTTGIDELPQLINVLKREMSIVGPRPCVPSECVAYTRGDRLRFEALPGLTGLWQVSGKNDLTFEQMIDCDIQYTLRKNLAMYLGIVIKTPSVLLKQTWRGVRHQSPIEDMPHRESHSHVQLEEKVAS
jgi:lipopolysaccharide/colanic/teichoic acid biosynthesis glycosyltransferase